MSHAEKCIQAINKKLEGMESGTVTLKGVRNLSRADLDSIKLYAKASIDGTLNRFMEPQRSVKDVLDKFNVPLTKNPF